MLFILIRNVLLLNFINICVAILYKGFGKQLKLVKLGCDINKILTFKYK